jgi:ABC-type multidrug transport system ATPase subunit
MPNSASPTYLIGSAADCAIRIEHPTVAPRHAQLAHANGAWVLSDLQSLSGTYVNGHRVVSVVVDASCQIAVGAVAVSLPQLLDAATRPPHAGPTAPGAGASGHPPVAAPTPAGLRDVIVGSRMLTIGRDARCDIVVDEGRVSGRHARVFRNLGRLILEDAGSANGTFVNSERVAWKVLTEGDVVQVGSQCFRFHREPKKLPDAPTARLDVRGVTIDVVDRESGRALRIVDNVTFTVLPGELVAIMGPSGSGKTTLLMALAGLTQPTLGNVELNAQSLYLPGGQFAEGFARLVGYAPQDDIIHELLTVEEAVRYSALLRCTPSLSAEEIERRVTAALQAVGMEHKRHTRVGSAVSKSLSGGQRKRVNIAMELVTDPPVLLLDEPTSGLSSKDAADLVDMLRKLADGGRTILMTLHQPSYPMFVQIDQLALLEQGQLAYYGPTAIDSFEFFQVRDRQPSALLDQIPVEGSPLWPARFSASSFYQRAVEARQGLPVEPESAISPPPERGSIGTLFTLLARGLKLKSRDKFFWIVAVLVPLFVASLFAFVLGAQIVQDSCALTREHTRAGVEHNYMIVLTIMVCFFGALSSCLEILRERAVLSRERRGGLSLSAYLCSKAVLFVIPALTHPLASLAVLHAFGGALEGGFLHQYAVLAPAFFAAACAGLCISASIGSAEGVIGLAVSYAIVQTVFSAFAALGGQSTLSQRLLDVAATPVTARWTLSGLVTSTDLCREAGEDAESGDAPPSVAPVMDLASLESPIPTVPGPAGAGARVGSALGRAPAAPDAVPGAGAMVSSAAMPEGFRGEDGPKRCVVGEGCEQDVCLRDRLFRERCETSYYRHHGVTTASTHAERTRLVHFTSSIVVNLVLALAALLAAALLLRRRST